MKTINTLCGLNTETFNVKAGGIYSNYSTSNPYALSVFEEVLLPTGALLVGEAVASDVATPASKAQETAK
jgi:hypothetical protein